MNLRDDASSIIGRQWQCGLAGGSLHNRILQSATYLESCVKVQHVSEERGLGVGSCPGDLIGLGDLQFSAELVEAAALSGVVEANKVISKVRGGEQIVAIKLPVGLIRDSLADKKPLEKIRRTIHMNQGCAQIDRISVFQ